MERTNRLYRSTTSRVFGGVAGGIAEYFDIDPILIRLLFVIIAFAGGGGVLVYLVLWIAIPQRPIIPPEFNMGSGFNPGQEAGAEAGAAGNDNAQAFNAEPFTMNSDKPEKTGKGALIGGLVLITLGCIFLADRFIPHISFHDLWPVILVVVGAVLIVTNFSEHKQNNK